MSTPGRPGFSSSSTFSTPVVTSRVFPHGCFSTMRRMPSPSLMTASPIRAGWPILHLRDIAEADGGTVAELDDRAGEVLGRGDEGELR
jgi:hypothetical protein